MVCLFFFSSLQNKSFTWKCCNPAKKLAVLVIWVKVYWLENQMNWQNEIRLNDNKQAVGIHAINHLGKRSFEMF